MEYQEVYSVDEVNNLAAQGWTLNSWHTGHQNAYMMERKRAPEGKPEPTVAPSQRQKKE